MRAILSKVVAGSMIAGAALLVSACGSKTETTANVTETNIVESGDMTNTVSDDMTAVDSANGADMMANDTMSNAAEAEPANAM